MDEVTLAQYLLSVIEWINSDKVIVVCTGTQYDVGEHLSIQSNGRFIVSQCESIRIIVFSIWQSSSDIVH